MKIFRRPSHCPLVHLSCHSSPFLFSSPALSIHFCCLFSLPPSTFCLSLLSFHYSPCVTLIPSLPTFLSSTPPVFSPTLSPHVLSLLTIPMSPFFIPFILSLHPCGISPPPSLSIPSLSIFQLLFLSLHTEWRLMCGSMGKNTAVGSDSLPLVGSPSDISIASPLSHTVNKQIPLDPST